MGQRDVIYKTGSTQFITKPPEEDRATTQPKAKWVENFLKFGQTDIQSLWKIPIGTLYSVHV